MDLESIGGGVPSPNMEKLAAQGLDYNGRQVDQGKMKATVFARLGVGEDSGQPVTPDYEPPFNGAIEKVTIDLMGDKHVARLKGGD